MNNEGFNEQEPRAYFITWTTYGTWLPGDERGWQKLNVGGIQPADPQRKAVALAKMTESEFVMTEKHREIVEQTIRRHCEIRGWYLHKVNPRTNHVHVVVTAPGYDPKTVREQFQAWCTRKLKEVIANRENFWTERGSARCINTEEELERVIQYAGEVQDLKHLEDLENSRSTAL